MDHGTLLFDVFEDSHYQIGESHGCRCLMKVRISISNQSSHGSNSSRELDYDYG